MRKHVCVGLAAGLVTCILSLFSFTGHLELKAYDLFHLLKQSPAPPEGIVIVAIDEPSFAEIRKQWPWPRSLHAQLINLLKAEGASVIGVDILFPEPSLPGEDRQLSTAIESAGNVVLASDKAVVGDGRYTQVISISPDPAFRKGSREGLATILPDRDNVVRRMPSQKRDEELFSEQIAAMHSGKRRPAPEGSYISYEGPPGTFKTVSYYQALDPSLYLPKDVFRGKIVLIGRSTQSSPEPEKQSADYFATPFMFTRGGLMSGAEIQANMVNTIMKGDFVRRLGAPESFLLFLLAGLAGSFLQYRWKPVPGGLLSLAAVGGYLAIACIAFVRYHQWVPTVTMVVPLFAPYAVFGIDAYLRSERKRKEIRKTFSHYLSPSVLDAVLAAPGKLRLGGERVEATILFSDIADFTALSETMQPEDVASLLNTYLDDMTRVILERKGTLDKFIGDGIMAFWGAPLPDPDHALNACRAALSMQESLASLREKLRGRGVPEIYMRIGINTGSVIAGNMGSSALFDYTVVGDAVNLASRLEGANKQFNTSIMISRAVYEKVADSVMVRPLGAVTVKGKTREVEVYELAGLGQG